MKPLDYFDLAIADPHNSDPDFLEAVAKDPALAQIVAEAKENDKLFQEFITDIPEPSAEHLAAIQDICNTPALDNVTPMPKRQINRFKPYLAIAASFAIMAVSMFMLSGNNHYNHNLMDHALSHTEHGLPFAGATDTNPSLQRVNQQLAVYGAKLTNVDDVLWSAHCDFEGVGSAHLVYQNHTQKVNVFLVPKSQKFEEIQARFGNEQFDGSITELEEGYLVIVGPKNSDITSFKSNMESQLDWSI